MTVSADKTLTGAVDWIELDNGTGAAQTAQRAAVTGKQHYVTGLTVSFDDAPDAAVRVLVQADSGGTPVILDAFYIPAAAIAPIRINYLHPLEAATGVTVELLIPDPGTGNAQAVLHGFTVTRI